jgi:hypothetical protein
MVKPQYLTGFLKAGIRPSLSRIPLDSASFEPPGADINQVLLTNMATHTAGAATAAMLTRLPRWARQRSRNLRRGRTSGLKPPQAELPGFASVWAFPSMGSSGRQNLGGRQTCSCRGESGSERNSLPPGYRRACPIAGFFRQWAKCCLAAQQIALISIR